MIHNCVIVFYSDKLDNSEIEEYVTDIMPIKLLPRRSLMSEILNSELNNGISIIDHFGVKIKKLRICVDNPLSAIMALKQRWNVSNIDYSTYIYLKFPFPSDYFENFRIKLLKQWIYRFRLKKYKIQHYYVKHAYSCNYYNGVINFPDKIIFNSKHNITHMLICITIKKDRNETHNQPNTPNASDIRRLNIYENEDNPDYVDKYYKLIEINNNEFDFKIYDYDYTSCKTNKCKLCHKTSIRIIRYYNVFDNIYYITTDRDYLKFWLDTDHEFSKNFNGVYSYYSMNGYNSKLHEKLIKYIAINHRNEKSGNRYKQTKCAYLEELLDLKEYEWIKLFSN